MPRSDTLSLTFAATARPEADVGVQAQMLGAPGARRGLREGAAALDRARAAYLKAEWSGADDRRPSAGLIRRTRA